MVGFGMKKEKDVIWKTKNSFNCLIKAGVNKMDKGELKPFFSIYEIIIPKEDYGKYGVEG